MLIQVAWAFFKRGALEAASYRAASLIRLAGLLITLGALFFFSRFVDAGDNAQLARYGGDYLSFGLAGLVLLNLQHVAVSSYPMTIRAAQVAGTLEAMLATPTPSWMVLLCAPAFGLVSAIAAATTALVLGSLLLGGGLSSANVPALLVASLLCPLAFASLGFFSATLTMLLRRTDPLSMFIGGASALAGGVFYPTTVLPDWLQTIGRLLPITHGLDLVRRAAFTGADLRELGPSLLAFGLASVIAAPLGLASFVWAIRRARREGSLSHF